MGFGYLNPDAAKLDLARRIANPGPAPETSFSLWSFGKAGLAGIPSAAFEIYGSTQDFMRGLDQSRAEDEARIAQAFGRAPKSVQIAEGGEVARLKADRFAPDPETAHTADQVMHGLTRFVGKAVGAVATTGPVAGPVIVGLEEGNTTAQRLMEGPSKVDKETAMKVGAVQGVMAGIGVALPAGGSTALRTAGIALAGGPATFVAQETLAKKILDQAGYAEEAAKRDPTDPLGLILSTIAPLAVGGLHMRGLAKAKAADDLRAKREGLSYAKEADLKDTAALTPAEQAASDAFERSAGNIKELEAAIKAEKNPQNKAILEAELQKLGGKAKTEIENAAIVKAAEDPEIVAAARVHLTEQVVSRDMPDIPGAHAEVLRAADSLAAGRMPDTPAISAPELPAINQAAEDLRGMGRAAFWAQEGGSILRSGKSEAGDGGMGGGVVGRTTWIPAEEWFGRMRSDLGASGLSKQKDIQDAIEASIRGEKLGAKQQRTVDWMRSEIASMREEAARVKYEWDGYDMVARDAFDAGLSSKDALDAGMVSRAAEIDEAAVERLAIQHADDDAAFMAGIREILGDEQPTAAAVKGERFDERRPEAPSTQAAEQPAARATDATAAKPAPSIDSQRLAKLEAENPDLPVMLPGETEAKTLSEALAEARATAADEASFADLVKVAAECALTAG